MQDFTPRVAALRNDREHGSRWLVREAIVLLRDLAEDGTRSSDERLRRVHEAGRELARARPAMAALAGAVGRVLATPGNAARVAQAARQLLRVYEQAPARITAFMRPHLRGTIMTHSLSGTVLDVLRACIPPIEQVIILEGRPACEGHTVARELSDLSAALTLITEAQADIFLPGCQAVVVGADSILADGSILNKAGTALLAWAARGHNVPFYVLSETLKIAPHPWRDDLALLEEHAGSEVWPESPPRVTIRNFSFDHTPAELVTQIVSEQGPLDLEYIMRQAAQLRAVADLL